jgi:hypothetical protein
LGRAIWGDERETKMATTYKKEYSISREHARKILASIGRAADYTEGADYCLCEDADGGEHLHRQGDDESLATNGTSMSWHVLPFEAGE